MTKPCVECGHPFDDEGYTWAVMCEKCCFLPDDKICFEALSLGEGSVECEWAAKGHAQPHRWRGEIGGAMVVIEWIAKGADNSSEKKA